MDASFLEGLIDRREEYRKPLTPKPAIRCPKPSDARLRRAREQLMESRRVDIGGGVHLEAEVAGSGPVTVVFENGLATALEAWDAVVPPIAARARTVRYNRRRAAATGDVPVRTAADLAADLRVLLDALGVSPPFVLVGHSWGGVVVRTFAQAHPADVVGLVLVDATHESIDSRGFALLPLMYGLMGLARRFAAGRRWLLGTLCPPGAPVGYRARLEQGVNDPALWRISLRTARSEGAGIRPSLAVLALDCPELPAIPVHVLTAGGVTGPNVKQIQRVHEAWKAMVARAAHARYTNVASSGHQMPVEVPAVVSDAIAGVLDAVASFAR
jgi:pimeloyl-ACP methyl ester carboxylesterase